MALGWGAGAELRQPLGIAIVGGLIVSQMLTLFTTPVIYLYLDRLQQAFQPRAAGFGTVPGFLIPGGLAESARLIATAIGKSLLLASLFCSACTSARRYQRPAAPTPVAFKEWQATTSGRWRLPAMT